MLNKKFFSRARASWKEWLRNHWKGTSKCSCVKEATKVEVREHFVWGWSWESICDTNLLFRSWNLYKVVRTWTSLFSLLFFHSSYSFYTFLSHKMITMESYDVLFGLVDLLFLALFLYLFHKIRRWFVTLALSLAQCLFEQSAFGNCRTLFRWIAISEKSKMNQSAEQLPYFSSRIHSDLLSHSPDDDYCRKMCSSFPL